MNHGSMGSWAQMLALVPVPSHSVVGRRLEDANGTVKQARMALTQEGMKQSLNLYIIR
jgi:hypothetical protein